MTMITSRNIQDTVRRMVANSVHKDVMSPEAFRKCLAEMLENHVIKALNQEAIKARIEEMREINIAMRKELNYAVGIDPRTSHRLTVSGISRRYSPYGTADIHFSKNYYLPSNSVSLDFLVPDTNDRKVIEKYISDWVDADNAKKAFSESATKLINSCRTFAALESKFPEIYKLTDHCMDKERKVKADQAEREAMRNLMSQMA